MSMHRSLALAFAALLLAPLASSCDDDDDNASTDTATDTATDTDTTSGSTTLTMVEPEMCPVFTSADDCPEPCNWVSFSTWTVDNDVCTPGEAVGQCVYVSGDIAAGCATFDNCPQPWGYLVVDGVKGFRPYCGGTSPAGWSQCSQEDLDGGVPECACACAN